MKSFIKEKLLDKNGKIHSKRANEGWFLKNGYQDHFNMIIEKTSFLSNPTFVQRLYHIINDIDTLVLCEYCKEKSPTFDTLSKGYRKYCSCKCQSEATKDKRKNTILEKCGEHPFQNKDNIEKRKKTCMEKYGSEFPFQSAKIQEKQKGTMLARYGVINPSSDVNIKEKMRRSIYERYGVNHISQTDEFKSQMKDFVFPNKSKGETEVFEFIKSIIDVDVMQGNRNILNGKELDIYIPDKNIAIEYCGLYWHSSKFKSKSYHKDKFDLCNVVGIKLITLFEDEWVGSKDIVKNKLSHLLGVNDNAKIHARKCSMRIISTVEKSNFLNSYHIQGNGNSSINIGLYYNEELVACMGFKVRGNKIFELDRYATKYIVVGGFNKLLEYFKKNYGWKEIITFADLRWHFGDVYINSGFVVDGVLPPDYQYIFNDKRVHKFNFRKSLMSKKFPDLYCEGKSESQNMKDMGIAKIYDCGKMRFKLL